ncbi:MAG TPA: hypothetical protein VEU31_10890 [Candidatus Acidoferrales bacterium]|nr:hypothetical protein [Candidatus Acidoferrales bacterium]
MTPSSVLIITDETEFARALTARWQAERHVPALTLVGSDLWSSKNPDGYDLVILGPVRREQPGSIIQALQPDIAVAVCVGGHTQTLATLRDEHPRLLVIPYQDGWTQALILVAAEILRGIEALRRAERAERAATDSARYATLGKYMLEMRHSVNNALTSVLGNADLLLLEPGQLSGLAREQIKTIHNMSLRLNEIFQRFSSLAAEIRELEKESQGETEGESHALARRW